MKILLCNKSYKQAEEMIKSILPEHEFISCAPDEISKYVDGVDILLPSVAHVDAETIRNSSLGLIQQLGVGVDSVDIEAATKEGVLVANVPGAGSGNAESVAELAILMMLTLARRADEARANLSRGVFFKPGGMALLNKGVCIIGLGDIGNALALRLKPFGLKITALREHPERGAAQETGIEKVYGLENLTDAIKDADFVVLAIPETQRTKNLINAKALAEMKQGAFLINVARGGVVDMGALREALQSKHLAGAGLDVFTEEPCDPDDPIFKENVIATPHIGGNTDESLKGVLKAVIENIKLYAQAQEPKNVLNKPSELRRQVKSSGA